MKDFIEYIDWVKVFLSIIIILGVSFFICLLVAVIRDVPPQYGTDTLRKVRVCRNYSNDFWRRDIEFIDGKCYYKGKEVEIK